MNQPSEEFAVALRRTFLFSLPTAASALAALGFFIAGAIPLLLFIVWIATMTAAGAFLAGGCAAWLRFRSHSSLSIRSLALAAVVSAACVAMCALSAVPPGMTFWGLLLGLTATVPQFIYLATRRLLPEPR
jgi:hypothetical protein